MKDPAERKYTLAVGAYRFLFYMFGHHFFFYKIAATIDYFGPTY